MRIYEELFIVRPDATEEEVDPLVEQMKGVITHAGGTIEKAEKWGMRKLAYRVSKHNEGQYILLVFNAKADTVKELERRLRARAQDAEGVVAARMARASNEISHWAEYDYVVINDDLDSTLTKIRTILDAERMKRGRQTGIAEFARDLMN